MCSGGKNHWNFIYFSHLKYPRFAIVVKSVWFLMSGGLGRILFVFNRFIRSVRCDSRGFPLLNLPPHVSDERRRNEVLRLFCLFFIHCRSLRFIAVHKTCENTTMFLWTVNIHHSGNVWKHRSFLIEFWLRSAGFGAKTETVNMGRVHGSADTFVDRSWKIGWSKTCCTDIDRKII